MLYLQSGSREQWIVVLSSTFIYQPSFYSVQVPGTQDIAVHSWALPHSVNPVQKVPRRHVQPELCPLAAIPDAVSMKSHNSPSQETLAFQVFLMYMLLLTFAVFVVQKYFFHLKRSKQAFKITMIQPTWNGFFKGQCLGGWGLGCVEPCVWPCGDDTGGHGFPEELAWCLALRCVTVA